MRRLNRRLAVLAALLLAAGGILALALRPAGKRSVLILSIDTMRPDAVGKGTPALEEFLKTATRFRGARTTAPLTLPAHLSLLSGLLPARTGIPDNSSAILPGSRGYTLLQEEFREAGYETAGFVASHVLDRSTGIGDGFDTYEEFRGSARGVPYVRADERAHGVIEWLRARKNDRPFFAFVHFYDPHAPYFPFPGDDRRRASSPREGAKGLYAGEVRRVDAAIEQILAATPADAIVLIVSDHGEGLGEHGEPTHGALCYGSTADCFLAVRAPGLEAGAVDGAPRSLCDVAPTLRAWCGLPARPGDGAPLDGDPLEAVVTQCIEVFRVHGWGQCFSASDGRYTLVESGPALELFDRATDPGETSPIDPRGHEAYERLDRAIAGVRGIRAGRQGPEYLPETEIPYASARRPVGTLLPREENARLLDPRPRLDWWRRLEEAQTLAKVGTEESTRAARDTLRALAEEEPGNPAPWYHLAEALRSRANATGDRAVTREGFRTAMRAIEQGYRSSAAFRLAFDLSRLSSEPEDLRAALLAAQDEALIPDLRCLDSAVNAALLLDRKGDGEARPLATALIERARLHLRFPEAQTTCARMLEMLQRP